MKRFISLSIYFLFFAFLVFISIFPSNCEDESPKPDKDAKKILFIGASYFETNDLPNMVKNLAEDSDYKIFIERDIISGTYLDYHSSSRETSVKIRKYKWDYVILEEECTTAGYPDSQYIIFPPYIEHDIHSALNIIVEKIRENCADTKIILMMPWAFEDGTTWLKGQNDTYQDMQKKVYSNVIKWAKEFNIITAPVGWAWYQVIKQKPSLHYLYFSDYNHPNLRGSYLMACVFYSTIFKKSVAGNGFISVLTQNEAEYFQQVASLVVLDSLKIWNIEP